MDQGPPQLPALVRGQKIRNGPFRVTVTDDMVRDRERQNAELARRWQRDQLRRRHLMEGNDDYFGEFQEFKVRRRFIRRVFSILTIQLIFTALVIAAFLFVQDVRVVIYHHPSLWMVAMGVFMFTYLAISCSDCARRQAPCNVLCLIMLTVSLAYLTATVSVFYSTEAVLLAASSTALVTLIITCIATCTKFDLTRYVGFMLIVTLLGTISLFVMILVMSLHFKRIPNLELAAALVGSLLVCMYMFFDVQTIMGGGVIAVEPDEVVYATAQLYVDVILLYRYLLMFIGIVNQ